jgi:actin-related protein
MNSASLSLFSTGATRGFVIEAGHGLITTVPVFEGHLLKHAMHKTHIAGDSINKYLLSELKKKGITINDC